MDIIRKTVPRGNYGVLLTPFSKDGKIDKKAFFEEINYCCKSSLTGLLVGGSTGEFIYMSPEQLKDVYSFVARNVVGKKVLIGGANAPTERLALDYIYFLYDSGYEYSLICPPYFYPQRPDDILRYYSFIASKAPKGMKILLYNIPLCAPAIPLNILKELISIENIVGLKDSSGDLVYLSKALSLACEIRPEFSIFVGQDSVLLSGLVLGAQGCISALSWILYKPVCEILFAYDRNDIKRAETFQKVIIPILMLVDKIPFPENYRILAAAAGIYCGEPQRAFAELEPNEFNEFINQMKCKIKDINFML